ncbi:MAG: hypothetical protein NT167_31355 [Verrucomicrobia bacterium]|nr:hypothetical protein [Verrucomicrobiota bacterium]
MRVGEWLDPKDLKLIIAIALTALGLMAAVVFNIAYFGYVLPFMRRQRGARAVVQAVFGVVHGQVFEYCRLAREGGSQRERKAATALRVSLAIFIVAFLALGALFLADL